MTNTKTNYQYVGIDIAKDSLVLAIPQKIKTSNWNNSKDAHKLLIQHLKNLEGHFCVVVEATGGYEAALVEALFSAQIPVAIVQPQRVRNFARSQGLIAKTDAIDAAIIARFAEVSQPRLFTKADQASADLQAMMSHRQHLIGELTRESNRLATASSALAPLIKKHIKWLERQIEVIEERIEQFVHETESIRLREERLRQIKGVGPILSRTLLAWMPEIGTLSAKQVAALAGVAPYNQDSATIHKRRCIYAGRSQVRAALYMASVASTRHNPILRDFYKRLRVNGKPPKVALTAVMRKLIILANNVLKNPDFVLA